MALIGTEQLARQASLKTALFKDWIVQAKWRNFWGSGEHFDWWAFRLMQIRARSSTLLVPTRTQSTRY